MKKQEVFQGNMLLRVEDKDFPDCQRCRVVVSPEKPVSGKEWLFSEATFTRGAFTNMESKAIPAKKLGQDLEEMTLNKARARISLGLFEKMWEYRQEINPDFMALSAPPITDELVQKKILTPLLNLRKKHPTEYRNQTVNLEGLCLILGISLDRFLFNASLLREEGMILEEGGKEGLGLETGRFFITSRGVRYLSSTKQPPVSRSSFQELYREGGELSGEFEYDVAISFAREDWALIEKLTEELKNRKIRVFYDAFEDSILWSKSLHEYLSYLHGHLARVCLLVLSRHYAIKSWTDHERVTAQARIIRENNEFILPLRVDDTVIPGMKESIGYIPVTDVPIDQMAELILARLVDSYI